MNPAPTVRASFATLAPRLGEVVARFYDALFDADPALRAKFPADMRRQREHLAAAVAVIVRNLESLDGLEESLMDLGARHVAFGVVPEHYPVFRDAMLQALARVSGDGWNPLVEDAWRRTLERICAMMLKGAAAAAIRMAQTLCPSHAAPRATTITSIPPRIG